MTVTVKTSPTTASPPAVPDARISTEPRVMTKVTLAPFETVSGPWDTAHLVRALADFATAADRGGAGDGSVECSVSVAHPVTIVFTSGTPAGDPKPPGPDLGFRFFRARGVILAMGGEVAIDRGARYARITVRLPSN